MSRPWLDIIATLTGPQIHILFLALVALGGALIASATVLVSIRRNSGSALVRGLGIVASLVLTAALWIARDTIDIGTGTLPDQLRFLLAWYIGFIGATSVTVGATAAAARTAVIGAATVGMCGLGTLIYLLLVSAVPTTADPMWELEHLIEFCMFVTSGFILLLTAGLASSRTQSWPVLAAYVLVGSVGLVALGQGFFIHPKPGLSIIIPTLAPGIGCAVWLLWRLFHRAPLVQSKATALQQGLIRIWEHPATTLTIVAAPLLVAGLALVLGGTGSARAASRISLGGLSITPGLITPFLFALALGLLVGQERWRWKGRSGIALTVLMALLLFAQKEVGNIAVIFLVASMVYLVARGTFLHLVAGAGLAGAGVIAAYQLAPIFSVIPFTFRERIHLWLGGAELLQRGGHLITATHVTYKLGGIWGLGIHDTPRLNLTRMVIAIHTDFPLTVIGLYGGLVLLSVFVVFVIAQAMLMLDTIRGLNFQGDTRRVRWHTPVLAGLLAVPVGSTMINLAGAITQITPFTGVPVMLISYSSIFLLGTFAVLAVFVVAGNRGALQQSSRVSIAQTQEANRKPPTLDLSAPRIQEQPPEIPTQTQHHHTFTQSRWLNAAGLRLAFASLRRSLRFRQIDGGILVLALSFVAMGVVLVAQLYIRYTDTSRYYGHPRLTSTLRIEPSSDKPGRWDVVEAPNASMLGTLEPNSKLQLDSLLLRFKDGLLQVRGGCFPKTHADQGITLGFEGMLDAPPLPYIEKAIRPTVDKAMAKLETEAVGNDIVLPFGDIALHHITVQRSSPGRYTIARNTAVADWTAIDGRGKPLPHPLEPALREGQGFSIGSTHPRRFVIREEQTQVCLRLLSGALAQYPLSPQGPTLVGNMALRRRQLAGRTTDFAYARDLKAAAEAGILTAAGPEGPIEVIPHAPEDRSAWDAPTRRLFYRVFRILKLRKSDGSLQEVLAWSRPFYADGNRRFSGTRELSAFIIHRDRVMGLADSYRFSRALPVLYNPMAPDRNGLIYDRNETPVTALDPKEGKLTTELPGATALLGYDFRRRGIRDGLLRVFAPMLRGIEPVPEAAEELDDRLTGRRRGPWGSDVFLTLDADIQAETFAALEAAGRKLDAREPGTVHHASAVVLGPRNEVLALAQWPDPGTITSINDALTYKKQQQASPLHAPALDAFHRRTTMGSTIKLLSMVSAFRHKNDTLLKWKDGEWYLNASEDPANSDKGRYAERGGALRSWRGRAIAPIHNYGKSSFGRVVPLRTLLVKSLNTASAYMGLNVGRERYEHMFEDIGLMQNVDLLPTELSDNGRFGHMIQRYPRDSASALPVSIGDIPVGEPWTPSLTARLPLSGLSDYSVMTTALGASIIARDGNYWPPRLVRSIRDRRTGKRTRFEQPEPIQIVAPEDAEVMTSYMKDVIRRGTGGAYRWKLDRTVWMNTGGKTGTGETVVPVDPNATYNRHNKPRTRDNKAFVAVWPTTSPQPFVVTVVFEQVSHLDRGIAIRTSQQIMKSVKARLARP